MNLNHWTAREVTVPLFFVCKASVCVWNVLITLLSASLLSHTITYFRLSYWAGQIVGKTWVNFYQVYQNINPVFSAPALEFAVFLQEALAPFHNQNFVIGVLNGYWSLTAPEHFSRHVENKYTYANITFVFLCLHTDLEQEFTLVFPLPHPPPVFNTLSSPFIPTPGLFLTSLPLVYWSTVDLQCWVMFWCAAKWFRFICIHIYVIYILLHIYYFPILLFSKM